MDSVQGNVRAISGDSESFPVGAFSITQLLSYETTESNEAQFPVKSEQKEGLGGYKRSGGEGDGTGSFPDDYGPDHDLPCTPHSLSSSSCRWPSSWNCVCNVHAPDKETRRRSTSLLSDNKAEDVLQSQLGEWTLQT